MAIFLSADIEVVVIVRPFGVTIVFDCPPHTSSDIHSENEKHCLTFSIFLFVFKSLYETKKYNHGE